MNRASDSFRSWGVIVGILLFWVTAASAGSVPTEEAFRAKLKPSEKLLSYRSENLRGLNREIARARIFDERTKTVSEVILTPTGRSTLDHRALGKLDHDKIRARFGAGGEGFDAKMDSKPAKESLFTVQLVAGTDSRKASDEIAGLGAKIEGRFADLISVQARPAIAKKIAHLPSVEAIIAEQPKTTQPSLPTRVRQSGGHNLL